MVVALVWVWVSISTLPTIAAGAESGVRPQPVPVADILSSRDDPTDAAREVSRQVAARAVGNRFVYGRISAAHGGVIDTPLRADSLAVITANFGRAAPGELAPNAGTTPAARSVATEAGSVNAVGGTHNCTSCVIAGDSTLAGSPAVFDVY